MGLSEQTCPSRLQLGRYGSLRPSSCSPISRGRAGTNLVGGGDDWRVHNGDYRILYEVHDNMLVVLVVAVGHRRDIYERR